MTSAGKKFADNRSRNDGDGHRELHRHASGEKVLKGLLQDRPTSHQEPDHRNHANGADRLPKFEPLRLQQ
jgi:hypothetical protein